MSRHMRPIQVLAAVIVAVAATAVPVAAQTVTRQSTPGGLAFRHVHMPEDSFQSLHFAWPDGSAMALPGKEALPWLGATLIMEGPRGLSRSAMFEDLRDLQATANLSAGVNFTQGSLSAPREKFAAATGLFARVLNDPALPANRLAELAKNWAVSSRQNDGNAETMAQRLFSRLVIADGPYRRYAMSDPAIYGRVRLADIDAWRRNILVRAGLILVSAGPLDAAEAGREIDRLFASLPAAGSVPTPAGPMLQAPGKLVVLERPVVQTAIVAGGPLTVAITPDLLRSQLAVSVLGSGTSSRLWLAVREKLGAAYGISAGMQSVDHNTRLLAIRSAVANDKAAGVLAAIREEYARFLTDGPTEAELDPLKRLYLSGHHDRLRRAPGVAAAMLTFALNGYPDDYLASYEQRLRGYTRAAIEADMRAAFPKPPLTVAVVAPSAAGFAADCVIKAPEDIARCD